MFTLPNKRGINMEELVMVDSESVYVTSDVIATKFNKEHRNLMRNIRSLMESQPEFGALNFERTTYATKQNKVHECFKMTRDGFCMIAMSLTGKEAEEWKVKYINAFNKMEDAIKSTPATMTSVNQIVKKAESDKQIASECGSQLAKYRKIKKENEDKLNDAMNSVQISLEFKE